MSSDLTTGDPVLETFALEFRWPCVDPFLFCVHHVDDYPEGNESLGPVASLDGRDLGQDFAGIDGWRMYHGSSVPGFPGHPHRGFETVTYVRRGLIDHSDSLGATARYGDGDVQWLTAGSGIVHAEMFPLVHLDEANPLELFQIWLNLPAADKLADPHFTMLWDGEVPITRYLDGSGRVAEVTVIAGTLAGTTPPDPPPNSWASKPEADVAIWHLRLEAGATWELPPARPGTARTLYFYEGESVEVGAGRLEASTGALIDASAAVLLRNGSSESQILVLQGRPIAEPVAQYGPFVMNTEDEIHQAFADFRRTGFGGWPFAADDPVHPREQVRFARHADGRVEERNPAT